MHEHPAIADRLDEMPGRIFSGKRIPPEATAAKGSRFVFFCYALPAQDHSVAPDTQGNMPWTEEAGKVAWYLFDMAGGKIVEEPTPIAPYVRSAPQTPRSCVLDKESLKDAQNRVEKYIRNTYLKSVQAPAGVKPVLKAWMELT